MTNLQEIRLLGTALVILGAALSVFTLNSSDPTTDGTLVFPIALVIGISVLVTFRPRKQK